MPRELDRHGDSPAVRLMAEQRVRKADAARLLADGIVTEDASLRRRNEPAARDYQDTMRRVRDTLVRELRSALRISAQEYDVIWTPMR